MGNSSHVGSLEEGPGPEQRSAINLSFGEAIERLKEGKMMRRFGWGAKGTFIFMQVPAIIHIDTVPKMQSLPQSVKDEFKKRSLATINYKDQIARVYPDNTITGFAPSPSDVLEEDWMEVD